MPEKRKRISVESALQTCEFQEQLLYGTSWHKLERFISRSPNIDNFELYTQYTVMELFVKWLTQNVSDWGLDPEHPCKKDYVALLNFCIRTGMRRDATLWTPDFQEFLFNSFVWDIIESSSFWETDFDISEIRIDPSNVWFWLHLLSLEQIRDLKIDANQIYPCMQKYHLQVSKTYESSLRFVALLKDDLDDHFLASCSKCANKAQEWFPIVIHQRKNSTAALKKCIAQKREDAQQEIVESLDLPTSITQLVGSYLAAPSFLHACIPA
jgi:hypothetical protein